MKLNEAILHGECIVRRVKSIPTTAKSISLKESYVIVADSETTGNHHVVDVVPGCTFFEEGETKWLSTTVDTQIRCVMADRHDTIVLPAGTYEFGFQQEYDPFTARMNKVRD